MAPLVGSIWAENSTGRIATEQPIDTGTDAGQGIPRHAGRSEFETNLRKHRPLEGIAAAKAPGAYKPPAEHRHDHGSASSQWRTWVELAGLGPRARTPAIRAECRLKAEERLQPCELFH
jgi:hypothetical protein